MLKHLTIRDMLIIDRLELEFSSGLNVLTGETGAGKSILLDSLGFVLGWRGRAELVRRGAEQGEVSASFELGAYHPALQPLQEAGLADGQDVILRRVNSKDGRKTAWINDRRVSGDLLRLISAHLLELHGQHDDRGLLDAKGHRGLLDQFAGHVELLETTRLAWRELAQAKADLQAELEALSTLKEEEEFLRHAVGELHELRPLVGEEAELDSKRRIMQASERLKVDIAKALQALGREAAEGMLSDALRWLEDASEEIDGKLDGAIEALSSSLSRLYDASSEIEKCLDDLEFNPQELESTEERLFAIRALARKHHVLPDDLLDLSESLSRKLDALDAGEGMVSEKRKRLLKAQERYNAAAEKLSDSRKVATKALDQAMEQELSPLKMDRAVFKTEISKTEAGSQGWDMVQFLVSTNPGTPAGPLAKIASGGELSRFLLALKVCLRTSEDTRTVIFDEIDRGVGGATADAVGRRLSALAENAQVLVVTHSPQVAAFASRHFKVYKTQSDHETLSRVEDLDPASRIGEIARMISGDTITSEARAAAEALIMMKD
ncbi:MAG: DNA repair protein RecN [Paracoccaceae bacterium]